MIENTSNGIHTIKKKVSFFVYCKCTNQICFDHEITWWQPLFECRFPNRWTKVEIDKPDITLFTLSLISFSRWKQASSLCKNHMPLIPSMHFDWRLPSHFWFCKFDNSTSWSLPLAAEAILGPQSDTYIQVGKEPSNIFPVRPEGGNIILDSVMGHLLPYANRTESLPAVDCTMNPIEGFTDML